MDLAGIENCINRKSIYFCVCTRNTFLTGMMCVWWINIQTQSRACWQTRKVTYYRSILNMPHIPYTMRMYIAVALCMSVSPKNRGLQSMQRSFLSSFPLQPWIHFYRLHVQQGFALKRPTFHSVSIFSITRISKQSNCIPEKDKYWKKKICSHILSVYIVPIHNCILHIKTKKVYHRPIMEYLDTGTEYFFKIKCLRYC